MTNTTKPALPEPAAETVMDLFQDHEGPVEALDYLPIGTKLYTADQLRAYGDARSAKAKAEVAALRKALKPFADADLTSPVVRDTFGFDVLRARAALQEKKP